MTTSRFIREWEYLSISKEGDGAAVTREQADGLLRVARSASDQLRLGGEEAGGGVLTDGRNRLRAAQVVGLLATRDVTLEILPKIDGNDAGRTRENLVRMLAKALDLPISDGVLSHLGVQRYDLLEILIRLFCDLLFEAVHRGLPRRYVACEDDLPMLRGRLDVIRQFTNFAGTPQKLACRYEELNTDVPLNQIMKCAVTRLRHIARTSDNQRRLFELGFAFTEVKEITPGRLPWDQIVLDRTNRTWADLLKLAKLLLGDRFQTTSAGIESGFSLLFEMNALFEEFIGRVLRATYLAGGARVVLQRMKGHAVIDSDGKGRFATIPDIVVETDSHEDWIIDTKWKRLKGSVDDPKFGVVQSDVYQMMAYSQVYQCNRLMLLYPHHKGINQTAGRLAEFRVSGTDDTQLVIATVDLSDIGAVPAQLKALLSSSVYAKRAPGWTPGLYPS